MIMNEYILINNKNSYADFNLQISDKNIGLPTKKTIYETIPFYNGYFDFSAIDGNVYLGERILTYTFDIVADTNQQLQELYRSVIVWLMDTQQSNIYDSESNTIYVGSLDKWSIEQDVLYMELTVTFKCQPYAILSTHTIHLDGLSTENIPSCELPTPLQIHMGNEDGKIHVILYTNEQQTTFEHYTNTYMGDYTYTLSDNNGLPVYNKYGGYAYTERLQGNTNLVTCDITYDERGL